ncbi:MAG: CTP synthase [Candidatus Yanofskybacteria bacterium]|nr:CTP synthase [Candidatus Yanofskybacteria bacterium]
MTKRSGTRTPRRTRFIFVAGGVMSGIGKGITVASTARILKDYGFRVSCVKIDPYLNVDAGTMNPTEHGEVFVTHDGMECDQDIGNYERFLDQDIPRTNYMTQGQVYLSVIQRERALAYGGKCVEPYPHILEEVQGRLERAAQESDAEFMLVEIGGTVGEHQNALFLEAARLMKLQAPDRVFFMLVSYFPIPAMLGEMKTKPTQNAVRQMQAVGIQPDIIIARSSVPLDRPRKEKVSVFCNVTPADIISAPDIKSIYDVPMNFEKDHLGRRILEKSGLRPRHHLSPAWRSMVRRMHSAHLPVRVGIVGKYFGTGDFTLSDSYLSVIEAVKHAAWKAGRRPQIEWLNAQQYEKDSSRVRELQRFDAVIVPGGFGSRGVEGKIAAIQFCREHGVPFLGLCYGMQLATIEFARNVARLKGAHTTEVDRRTKHPVVSTMTEQVANIQGGTMGGSMRLGAYTCKLAADSVSAHAYGGGTISERHRHRYEFNNGYRDRLAAHGLRIAGVNPERDLVEIIELPGHPFFVGTQFHPELQSRPLSPHPLFVGLIRAACARAEKR